jgi:hypothetical protein
VRLNNDTKRYELRFYRLIFSGFREKLFKLICKTAGIARCQMIWVLKDNLAISHGWAHGLIADGVVEIESCRVAEFPQNRRFIRLIRECNTSECIAGWIPSVFNALRVVEID